MQSHLGGRGSGWQWLTAAVLAAALLAGCGDWPIPTATPSLTPAGASVMVLSAISVLDPTTAMPMSTDTATATMTLTLTPSVTSSATASPAPTDTPTVEPTSTLLPATEAPTLTLTPTPMPTPTATVSPTLEPTPDGTTRTLIVPILMYHYISVPPADAGPVRRDLSVTPENLRAHLEMLRAEGYEPISLEQLVLALQVGQPLPVRPVIITFDDGYRDNYTEAFRILREEGMTGTFFLVTKTLDEERPEYLSWDMVIEMHEAGMEIGSHSYEHVDLAGRSEEYLVYQLLGSREAIEQRIGEPVRFFSYPSGNYDALTMRMLRETQYWAAVSVAQGATQRSDALYELERIRVRGSYDAAKLSRVIAETCASAGP
ncbi:MAG: polysaccharide deacetylase family protein [Anaerolineales bacterium]